MSRYFKKKLNKNFQEGTGKTTVRLIFGVILYSGLSGIYFVGVGDKLNLFQNN